MSAVFELKNIKVSLNNKQKTELVKGVSFSVNAGECLGILGESGSGKSMSIKAAMGLLDKNFNVSGSAKFKGDELIGKNPEELRKLRGGKVGIVLQNPMTCFDPLYRIGNQISETFLAHNSWSSSEIRERSITMLNKMQIRNPEEVLEKYPHQLSGGMLQRCMIAIAITMEPDIIIADEPTTALDCINQKEVIQQFKTLREFTGTSLIFISHDLGIVQHLAQDILVMKDGIQVEYENASQIFKNPKDKYTKYLIDTRLQLTEPFIKSMYKKEEVI